MYQFVFLLAMAATPILANAADCPELLNFSMTRLRSTETINFCQAYKNKVVLAVNTASNCGYTPQFEGLEKLYQKYKDAGLVVLGFPSADFKQEFADAEKTATVCFVNYGVTFPMFTTGPVTGADANAFFKQLSKLGGSEPKWNFHKYLINRKGDKVSAYGSATTPAQLEEVITKLLAE
ncbi:glutathione peroxidase [Methylosoma difficile]